MEQYEPDNNFSQFVRGHWAKLVRSTVLMGVDPHLAEDIVQTALLNCFNRWDKISSLENPDGYVFRSVLNAVSDHFRKKSSHESVLLELLDGEAADRYDVHERDQLLIALAKLPEPLRAVMVLRFYVDASEVQTAHVLRVPVGTVKSRCSRALQALRSDPCLSDAQLKGKES